MARDVHRNLVRQFAGRLRLPRRLAAAFVLLIAVIGAAPAASLQVAPTSLTLQARQNADGLWLSNSGDAPVQVQLRVFRWTQADGEETLAPTQDLVISPPMQTLPAGQRQLVRVVRHAALPPAAETTYRIIVDELPTAEKTTGLQFVLRYSIPIFIVPETPAVLAPDLQARLLGAGGGEAVLEVSNRGTQHAQIADLGYARGSDGGQAIEPLIPGLVGYVLAGQTMRWSLKSPMSRFTDAVFKARINSETDARPLPLAGAAR